MLRPFRYDTLLRVRKRQEELKAQALAEVRHGISLAEQQREDISRYQVETLTHASERAGKLFDASDVRRYYQFERHLARLAVEKDAEILELKRVEEVKRTELEEAMKRRRIIEKLKERKHQAFSREMNRQEQKSADEIAGNHFAIDRKSSGES